MSGDCDHDHEIHGLSGRDLTAELVAAEQRLARDEQRLTAPRRRVLELLLEAGQPVKAYDLISSFGEAGEPAKPPTVYRALDFLEKQGFVHRIESLNAFIGCPSPKAPHSGQFLLCTACGTAAEITDPGIQAALAGAAGRAGFRPSHVTLEVKGLCRHCQPGAAAERHAHTH